MNEINEEKTRKKLTKETREEYKEIKGKDRIKGKNEGRQDSTHYHP
jgi:hypothetical protein